jgi:hypothetical protein
MVGGLREGRMSRGKGGRVEDLGLGRRSGRRIFLWKCRNNKHNTPDNQYSSI